MSSIELRLLSPASGRGPVTAVVLVIWARLNCAVHCAFAVWGPRHREGLVSPCLAQLLVVKDGIYEIIYSLLDLWKGYQLN